MVTEKGNTSSLYPYPLLMQLPKLVKSLPTLQYLAHLQFALLSASFNLNVWFTPGSFPLETLRPPKTIYTKRDRDQALTRGLAVGNFVLFFELSGMKHLNICRLLISRTCLLTLLLFFWLMMLSKCKQAFKRNKKALWNFLLSLSVECLHIN